MSLPITFGALRSPTTLRGCGDTGTEVNAITKDLASLIGLPMKFDQKYLSVLFQLPNGKYLRPCAYVSTTCSFRVETEKPHCPTSSFKFDIFVFGKLAEPGFLIGRRFLEATQTLTSHLHRFVPCAPSVELLPRIRSLTTPTKSIKCCINGIKTRAVADTGADFDIMSESFAVSHGLNVELQEGWFTFADDSVGTICGLVAADVVIGVDLPTYEPRQQALRDEYRGKASGQIVDDATEDSQQDEDYCRVVETQFFVVNGLIRDVYIGDKSLAVLEPFRLNKDDFELDTENDDGSIPISRVQDVGTITRVVESGVSAVRNTRREIRGALTSTSTSTEGQETNMEDAWRLHPSSSFRLTSLQKATQMAIEGADSMT